MPKAQNGRGRRTSRRMAATLAQINYNEDSDSSSDESDMGMLAEVSLILNHFGSSKRPRRPTSAGRPKKKRCTSAASAEGCEHCGGCKKKRQNSTPKRKNAKKNANKTQTEPVASTSRALMINLDSEEENKSQVTESHVDNIKKKLGGFFQALESDDEGNDRSTLTLTPQKRTKDFYTILSDSDDDVISPSPDLNKRAVTDTQPPIISLDDTQPSVISLDDTQNSQNNDEVDKLDELLAYVNDVLNECDDVIDVTDDNQSKAPMMSLEELKKKTDEILKDVASCGDALDDFLPKAKEPETKSTPVKEAPICPVCLEALGGSRQAMATLCGHMFCHPCLTQVMQATKKCPSCRKKLNKSKYHPVYI